MITRIFNPEKFTGWHMLGVLFLFFGTIISVNLTLATFASKSWTGLVVQNSYVAGQEFDEKAAEGRAQAALGWKSILTVAGGRVGYALADASGSPIVIRSATAAFRRPAYESEDMTVTLTAAEDRGVAAQGVNVRDGIWIIEINATTDPSGERPYRDVRRVVISDGALK